jgi:GAF domain-containing protein
MRTLGDIGALAAAACEQQYGLGDGPTPAALAADSVVVPDLADEPRWPTAAAALRELGVRSVLSLRLQTATDGPIGALTLVARRPHALPLEIVPSLEGVRLTVSVALAALRTREQVAQLEQAVRSNRDIGVAMGIVMAHRLVTRDEAFELLRRASQHQHRKLVEVADEVIRTGLLEYSDTSWWSDRR